MALVLLAILLPIFLRASAYPSHRHHHHHSHWPHHDDDSVSVTETSSGIAVPTSVALPPTQTDTIIETTAVPSSTEVSFPESTTETVSGTDDIPSSTDVSFSETETETVDVPSSTEVSVPSPTVIDTSTGEAEPTESSTEATEEPAPTSVDQEPSTGLPATPVPSGNVPFPANAKFDYQIGGPYTPASGVKVVTRDHTASPVSGLYNICYINAFQSQPDDASWWKSGERDSLLLRNKNGGYFEDPDWEGEFFLDTSTAAKRQALATIVNGWVDECAKKGFNAIEPDNLDTFTRSDGLLSADNNLAFAKLFTDHAHSLGLAVAQKNTGGELGSKGKSSAGFDFAVAEECQQYDECNEYTDVYGANVLEIEYTDSGKSAFTAACNARGKDISVILRDRNVEPAGSGAYQYQEC